MTTLESILRQMRIGEEEASNATEYGGSWGHLIYRKLMELNPVIASERVWPIASRACEVREVANLNGCSYDPVRFHPLHWRSDKVAPHSLLNTASWAYFASGVYFQKAMNLSRPGRPINDCGIYTPDPSLTNITYTGSQSDPENILLHIVDRTDGTFDAQMPPDPAPENVPPDDPPTPSLPYGFSDLPSGLATPFDAEAYFAAYTPAAVSSSSAPSL